MPNATECRNTKGEHDHAVGHLSERKVGRITVLRWNCSEKVLILVNHFHVIKTEKFCSLTRNPK